MRALGPLQSVKLKKNLIKFLLIYLGEVQLSDQSPP